MSDKGDNCNNDHFRMLEYFTKWINVKADEFFVGKKAKIKRIMPRNTCNLNIWLGGKLKFYPKNIAYISNGTIEIKIQIYPKLIFKSFFHFYKFHTQSTITQNNNMNKSSII